MKKSINVNEFLRFWQSLEGLAKIENSNLTKDDLLVKINKTYHLANIAFGQGGANLISTAIIKVSEQSDINEKINALVQNDYTIAQICEALGLHRTTFYKKNKNNTWNKKDFEAINKLFYEFEIKNVEKEKLQNTVIESTAKNVEKEKLQKPVIESTAKNVEKEMLQNYNELKTIVKNWQNQYKKEKVLRVHKKEIAKFKKLLVWKRLPQKAREFQYLKYLKWIEKESGIFEANRGEQWLMAIKL